ncbi:hypothetical protein D3C87_1360140 [compost metagenome]
MDDLLAIDVFNDCAVAARIRKGKVQGRQAFFARHIVGHDGEGVLLECADRLFDGREIIEHILRPGGDGQARSFSVIGGVTRLDKPEDVCSKSGFIHAVCRGNIIARRDDAAIFRGPFDRIRAGLAGALHAAGEDPDIGSHIRFPIHRPGRHHLIIFAEIHESRTGFGNRCGQCRDRQYCGSAGGKNRQGLQAHGKASGARDARYSV